MRTDTYDFPIMRSFYELLGKNSQKTGKLPTDINFTGGIRSCSPVVLEAWVRTTRGVWQFMWTRNILYEHLPAI
jgi:hypothetical protein